MYQKHINTLKRILSPQIAIIIFVTFVTFVTFDELFGFTKFLTLTLTIIVPVLVYNMLISLKGKEDILSNNNSQNKLSLNNLFVLNDKLENHEKKLVALSQMMNIYESNMGLSEQDKQEIINKASAQISEETINQIFVEKTSTLQIEIEKQINLESIMKSSNKLIERLYRELNRLKLNSAMNLMIGMTITTIGMFFLVQTVLQYNLTYNVSRDINAVTQGAMQIEFILPLFSRFFLVLFIEIFAYFFLKLYKETLTEIKYFQNELTNIESKMMAVEVSYITKNNEALKEAILCLSKTERNYILKKGETTVELERAKSDSEVSKNIVNSISDFLKKQNSKN